MAAVRRLQLLDTLPDEAFDRLTRMVARALDVPIALVNLIDADRQFFKSAVGTGDLRELPADISICQHALASREPLVIEDVRLDSRFTANALNRETGIVAYMGVPILAAGGHAVGTFCVFDRRPRQWTSEELEMVRDLGAVATTEIDLRLAEAELMTERARLAAVFEQAPAFMATSRGPNHVLEMVNAHFYEVSGQREFVGKPVAEALPELEAQGILQLLDAVYETGEPFVGHRMAMELERGVGGPLEERILNLVYQPIRESDGTISGLLAHGVDVTDQVKAQEKIAAAEAHYRRLVNNSPQPIYGQDRNGAFTDLNPAGEKLLGVSARDLIGKHFRAVVAPKDMPQALDVFDRLMEGEPGPLEYELDVVRPDGEARLIVLTVAGIVEGDQVVGVQGIARDITAERQAQEQIRLLAAALQNLAEGVSITRLDGQIVYANAAHGRLLGYDANVRPLPNAHELIPDAQSEDQLRGILESMAEEGAWSGRVRRRRLDDGQMVPMEIIVGSVEREDDEQLIIAISRDISGEIEREKHLRRTERLASLGTLVGGVAHELNNPLQAIQSFSELLVDEWSGERRTEDLLTIQREAAWAARIVADLRMLARSTQEGATPRAPVDLNDVSRHVLRTRRYALETGNVEIREELAPDLPPVMADPGQLEQVLLNLIVNAEQAMAAYEAPRRLTIETFVSGDQVMLRLVDTGPGIAEQHLERIFDPFWTTKDPGEGTGLGLSLVHSIVTEHGGTVAVDSTVGVGCEFRIGLPQAGVAAEAEPAPASTPGSSRADTEALPPPNSSAPAAPVASVAPDESGAPVRPLRILLVDDEDAVRRVFSRFLSLRGHHVDLATDGAEALRMLSASAGDAPYDVIVSDLRMPGLDGEAFFKRLQAGGSGMERKMIFMTGDSASGQAARVLGGLDAPVLFKPMKLNEAARIIERHADHDGVPLGA